MRVKKELSLLSTWDPWHWAMEVSMVTTAMLTRAILIVPNMGNQMLYVLCVAGYKEQLIRTYYIFCVQNHKMN